MAIKYYIDPISHDLLRYEFDTQEITVLQKIDNVRVLLAGQVIEDEDYLDSGIEHDRRAGKKSTVRKKKSIDFMSQKERIKDLLSEDPDMKSYDISEETGIPINNVYEQRKRLKKEGAI